MYPQVWTNKAPKSSQLNSVPINCAVLRTRIHPESSMLTVGIVLAFPSAEVWNVCEEQAYSSAMLAGMGGSSDMALRNVQLRRPAHGPNYYKPFDQRHGPKIIHNHSGTSHLLLSSSTEVRVPRIQRQVGVELDFTRGQSTLQEGWSYSWRLEKREKAVGAKCQWG